MYQAVERQTFIGRNFVEFQLVEVAIIPEARLGFTVDLKFKSFNQTIVRNGIVINSSYFDRDLDNVVYRAPYDDSQTIFYLYMNSEDLKGIDKTKDAFTAMARTKLKSPRVDGDLAIMNPKLIYEKSHLDTITQERIPLILQYQCLKNEGESTIELNIEFEYYKAITLFFKKCCHKGNHLGMSLEGRSKTSLFFIFATLLVITYLVAIAYSFYVKKENLQDSLKLKYLRSLDLKKMKFRDNALLKKKDDDLESKEEQEGIGQNDNYGNLN